MRFIACLLVMAFVGCGPAGEKPKLYPVSGTLTVDDTPVADILIQLFPIEASKWARPSDGITDKNGRFQLSCNGERGAAQGKYKLVLAKVDGTMSSNMSNEKMMQLHHEAAKEASKGGEVDTKLPFPEEYLLPETSPGEVPGSAATKLMVHKELRTETVRSIRRPFVFQQDSSYLGAA